jgi:hypothetical protein
MKLLILNYYHKHDNLLKIDLNIMKDKTNYLSMSQLSNNCNFEQKI